MQNKAAGAPYAVPRPGITAIMQIPHDKRKTMQPIGARTENSLQQTFISPYTWLCAQIGDLTDVLIDKHVVFGNSAYIIEYNRGLENTRKRLLGKINETIGRGFRSNISYEDLAKQISKIYTGETKNLAGWAADILGRRMNDLRLDMLIRSGVTEFAIKASNDACPLCEEAARKTYTEDEVKTIVIPLHPNCRCIWEAKTTKVNGNPSDDYAGDYDLAYLERSGQSDSKEQEQQSMEEAWNGFQSKIQNEAGLQNDYPIDMSALHKSISPFHWFTQGFPSMNESEPIIGIDGLYLQDMIDQMAQGYVDFLESAVYNPVIKFSADTTIMWNELVAAQTQRIRNIRNPFDALDWLTYGTLTANRNRWDTVTHEPNLYNIANWLTSGSPDMLKGAFHPEQPLSPEHWLNSLGVASSLLGVYKMVQVKMAPIKPENAMKTVGRESGETTGGKREAKTFTSTDKYVGEVANTIESKYPNRVVGVNKKVFRPDGSLLTDFDIELDNMIIQVKSGTGKGLTKQLTKTATGTPKTVIGYTPNLNPTSALVKGAKALGFDGFTTPEDLLNFLANHELGGIKK